ncbi:hypothetical protein, partial [Burkholderia cenocepacia]|uniref:hypothetical protein n=1 Tax=Burkholderia cenocepacia TaxID=95486 RepID=UPI002B241BAD
MSSLICSFKLIFHPGWKRESDARERASTQKPAWDSVSSGLLESGIGDSPPDRLRDRTRSHGVAGAPLSEPRGAQSFSTASSA